VVRFFVGCHFELFPVQGHADHVAWLEELFEDWLLAVFEVRKAAVSEQNEVSLGA